MATDYKYIKRYTLYYVTMKVKRTAIIKKKDCQQVDIEKGLTSLSIEFRRFNQVPPGKKTIQQNFTKYCSYGTSLTRNEENSGRQRNARSEENIKLVRNIIWQAYWVKIFRSSPQVFVKTAVLQICSKFIREHSCGNVISIKLVCNFTETTLPHGCFPLYVLHICRKHYLRNIYGRLLLNLQCYKISLSDIKKAYDSSPI